jgi:RNA polymerase sigma-70 factor (ECF subfamily)
MADGAIRDILELSIDELPDELRTLFVACVVDGMTPEQFAELSALTSETVNARLHNARNLLVEVLVRQFGPVFGGVYELHDSRSERITNAVMDRLFPRR